MRVLGAILAGGGSTRFDGDKAAALVGGRALLDHVADALRGQAEALVVCGREWPGLTSLADRPAPDMGPLGGLCAALCHARDKGFDAVLSAGCDVLPVPVTALRMSEYIDGQPLFGLWPADLAERLDRHLATQPDRSMRRWIAASGMRPVLSAVALHNLNTRDDLALYCAAQGPRP